MTKTSGELGKNKSRSVPRVNTGLAREKIDYSGKTGRSKNKNKKNRLCAGEKTKKRGSRGGGRIGRRKGQKIQKKNENLIRGR